MIKKTEEGSALFVAVIVAVILLISTLGYMFWRNTQPTTPSQENTSTNESAKSGAEIKSFTTAGVFPTQLKFEYPDTWALESGGTIPEELDDNAPYGQTVTLESPSGNYTVTYVLAYGAGIGGACLPDSSGTLRYVNQYKGAVVDGSSVVALVYDNYDQPEGGAKSLAGYSYDVSLYDKSITSTKLAVDDSYCDVVMRDVLTLNEPAQGSVSDFKLLQAKLTLNKISSSDYATSVSELTDQMSGEEYEQGIAILKSTKRN